MKFSSRGFTLVELMIVMSIIGIMAAALFPTLTGYIQRGRDTRRATDIDNIAKNLTLYFSNNEKYPSADVAGCLDGTALTAYLTVPVDPISTNYNGCNTLGRYAYAMSTGILLNPNVFSLLAIMERPTTGNYGGSIFGFTGVLTSSAYNTGITLLVRGSGQYYIRVP